MKYDLKYLLLAVFAIGWFTGVLVTSLKLTPDVHAVNFTVDLTTAEVATATWKWNSVDSGHIKWATVNLFGQDAVKNLVAEWENQRIAAFAQQNAKCQMWNFLSPAEKSAVCATINEVSTCTIPGC